MDDELQGSAVPPLESSSKYHWNKQQSDYLFGEEEEEDGHGPWRRRESMVNKLISTVYSGPTISDIESALSLTDQQQLLAAVNSMDDNARNKYYDSATTASSPAVVFSPEKVLSKMENKYTLKIKTCGNGLAAEDGYKWRKYGQKTIKNSPNPRSYYRCTNPRCNAKKQVERAMDEADTLLVTYEGLHLHYTYTPHLSAFFHPPAAAAPSAAAEGSILTTTTSSSKKPKLQPRGPPPAAIFDADHDDAPPPPPPPPPPPQHHHLLSSSSPAQDEMSSPHSQQQHPHGGDAPAAAACYLDNDDEDGDDDAGLLLLGGGGVFQQFHRHHHQQKHPVDYDYCCFVGNQQQIIIEEPQRTTMNNNNDGLLEDVVPLLVRRPCSSSTSTSTSTTSPGAATTSSPSPSLSTSSSVSWNPTSPYIDMAILSNIF